MIRLAPIALGLASVACTPQQPAEPPSPPTAGQGLCDATKVQDVIGKPRSDAVAEDARQRSGAAIVRYLTPDMVVTMEYRGDRLNLHLGTDGRIGSARCG